MKNKIHFNQEERLADNTERTVSAINDTGRRIEENTKAVKDKTVETIGFTGVVKSLNNNHRKLDEIKSASLIANQELKKLPKKGDIQKIEITNDHDKLAQAFWTMLKGKDGHTPTEEELLELIMPLIPEPAQDGHTPTQEELLDLIRPLIPERAEDGHTPTEEELLMLIKPLIPAPINGQDGEDGENGKDGSPDTPEEVVDKVNASTKKILWKQIKDVPDFSTRDTMNQVGYAVGGGNVVKFLSNGVQISAHVTEINFSTNITPTYDGNGRITLTATGGGGTTHTETPVGDIDGVNVTYTVDNSITTVINFAIGGVFIHPSEYSTSGTTITMTTALDESLSGQPFTFIYQ